MTALTRRQRIQRVISPMPLPESMIPLLRLASANWQEAINRAVALEARQATIEHLVLPHVEMLEQAWPQRFKQVSDCAIGTEHALKALVQAAATSANDAKTYAGALKGALDRYEAAVKRMQSRGAKAYLLRLLKVK